MNPKLHKPLIVLLILTASAALWGLLARVWFEIDSQMLARDPFLFQTVGNAILNGLTPYTDLFETKPPGVFLLHAASWKFFESAFLVKLVQAVVLLGIALFVVIGGIPYIEDRPPKLRQVLSLLLILFGTLLALYSANQSGWGLPESHGAMLGIAFLMVAGCRLSVVGKYVSLGLLLLLAAGLKEPIVLSILGGFILLDRSDDLKSSTVSLFHCFIVPFVIAAVIGIIALFALGWFDAFFGTYMRYMLGFHVGQEPTPLPIRALQIWRVFENIGVYSWWFAGAITLLWVWIPIRAWVWGSKAMAVRWLLGSYLTMLAVAMGGSFYGHHFVFAVPFFAALFWEAVTALPKKPEQFLVPLAVLLLGAAVLDTKWSYSDLTATWRESDAEYRSVAVIIDDIMDRCGWEKYLQMMPRGMGPYAYTKHSPYGPVFIHYSREIGALKEFQSAYIKALQQAPMMLMTESQDSNLSDFALQYVGVHFADTPPACVGEDFTQPRPYHLLFRQEK